MRRLGLAAATLFLFVLSACGGSSTPKAHAKPPPGAPSRFATTAAGCDTKEGQTHTLPGVRTAMLSVPGNPFGVASSADGVWSFFSLGATVAASDGSFVPVLRRQVTVTGRTLGAALTHDGRYLLAADGRGAVVIDVDKLETDGPDAQVGTLTSNGDGAIEVLVSPDNRYGFVTLESASAMAVFDLAGALSHGFGPQNLVGTVPLGEAPVGMAVSPDGRWLYATSEGAPGQRGVGKGILSVISLAKAEMDPSTAVVSRVTAGCSPVRVVVSHDGKTVWVTARASDALLGFSASALVADPGHALLAKVQVGSAPVGLVMVKNGTRIVVADSNRFGGGAANLAVVDTRAALAGRPALLGTIPAGRFPREMAVHDNTLLVTNYTSGQLESVDLRTLP